MPPSPRGRPKSVQAAPAATANPYTALWPPDTTKVECQLCHEEVTSVASHLQQKHPTVRLVEYQEMFKSAPIVGEVNPAKEPARELTVTPEEATEHPGGREAAMKEKTLDERERSAYRSDVVALLDQGHKPSHQVASVAYLMTLSRRVQLSIEATREVTKGELYHSEALETFHDLEAKIGRGIQDLEKIRAQRVDEAGEDPLAVVEYELEGAEAWVQAHIGEFQFRCPGCGDMLTVPALPHWAFEPLRTDQGVVWPVWSPEMWKLVLSAELSLAKMAYMLRTSPEGLKYTAARRGEPWPDDMDVAEAEIELRARLLADDRMIRAALLPATVVVGEGGSNGVH
jgi:hypothetical protein